MILKFGRGSEARIRMDGLKIFAFCRVALGLLSLFLSLTGTVRAENRVPLIGNVEVWVDGTAGGEEVRDLISLKEGEPFSLFLIRNAVDHLHRTGLFSAIQVYRQGEDPVQLIFHLQRRLFVRQVSFSIRGELAPEVVSSGLISLREGEPYDEKSLEQGKAEIRKALEREGYFQPEIQVTVEKIPQSGLVDLRWRIVPGRRLKIYELRWEGNTEKLDPKERSLVNLQPGEDYNPRQLEERCQAIQQRLRRRGFTRAEVTWKASLRQEEGQAEVTVVIRTYERIIFNFQGARVPVTIVAPLWEERVFEEWALTEGEARILRYLRRKGYIKAEVDSSFEKKDDEIRVNYFIKPGPRLRIAAILFSGQVHFTAENLRQILGIPAKASFASLVDGERVYDLPRQLEAFYHSQGFPEARVTLELLQQKRGLVARFHIEEGRFEKIGLIEFRGNHSFPADSLRRVLQSQSGSPYYPPQVQLDRQRLLDFYLQQGFRGTTVTVEETSEGQGVHSLRFQIEEGQRYRVRRIFFSGLLITKKSTVQKELKIGEGDWAGEGAIQQSKRYLERLGIFSEVQVEEIPVSSDELDLIFRFREGERNYASVGVGLETKTEPRSFEVWNNVLRLRGTAEIVRSNLFGDASQLSFVSQMSLKETRGVISWEQPYFFAFPVRTSLNAWLEREERISFGFDRRGISLTGIKPLTGDLMTVFTLRYARTVLTHLEITESEVDRQFFPFSSTSISASIIRDRRDDTFNPEKGYFASAVLEWAYPLFHAEAEFVKTFLKYQRFFSFIPSWNLATTFRLGLGRGRIPIHERFFAGGSNSFRGEEFDELGPKDPSSNKPVGGKALFLLNLELHFPLLASLPNLNGAVFYDLGNVFSKRSQFNLTALEDALGLGIRYRTPLGPLRLELAWNLSRRERRAKPLLFITIGQIF